MNKQSESTSFVRVIKEKLKDVRWPNFEASDVSNLDPLRSNYLLSKNLENNIEIRSESKR